MINREDLAWVGGLFEGEGYIGAQHSQQGLKLVAKICMCDEDVLRRAHYLFGGSLYGPMPASGLGTKPRWEWKLVGKRAYWLVVMIWPWMLERRREQIRSSVTAWTAQSPYRKLTPPQVATIRQQLKTGTHGIGRQLAKEYNVTEGLISAIKYGRTWKVAV